MVFVPTTGIVAGSNVHALNPFSKGLVGDTIGEAQTGAVADELTVSTWPDVPMDSDVPVPDPVPYPIWPAAE